MTMPFNDTVTISFVSFNKHVNLGGESAKTLYAHGELCKLELHASGMVKVTKPQGQFWVSAACIESVEQDISWQTDVNADPEHQKRAHDAEMAQKAENAAEGHEKADYLKDKSAKATKTRDIAPKTGKMTNSVPPMSRADEILAEFNAK